MAQEGLGTVSLDQKREAEALQPFEASLTVEGVTLPPASSLAGLARLAARRRNFVRALTLHGASWVTPRLGWRRPLADLERQPWIGAARRALGPEAADAGWRAGAAMTAPEAVAYAL